MGTKIRNKFESNKSYVKWLARVKDVKTPWTEEEIIYFRKAVGRSGIKDQELKLDLLYEFNMRADAKGYRITFGHDVKGQHYMLSKSLRKDGTLRKGSKLGYREITILKTLKHHKLVGVRNMVPTNFTYSNMENAYFLPIYRAVSRSGESFDYIGTTYEQVEVIS